MQSMEYTITTPLLSAIILAASSPTVPTGMVQWLFVCLLASHLLCTPILYLSHISVAYRDEAYTYFHSGSISMAVLLLLFACFGLQVNAFVIKMLYITTSWNYYSPDAVLQGAVFFLLSLQILFVVTVALVAAASMVESDKNSLASMAKWFADKSSMMYMVMNFLIKFVVGIIVCVTAINRHFPMSLCDIWEGKYASPDPFPM